METRNEKWQSLRLYSQKFTAQDYVAVCEYYMDGVDPISGTTITSSTKFWPDEGVEGVIDGNEFLKGAKANTDGAGWGTVDHVLKAWWAVNFDVAEAIYNDHSQFETYQQAGEAGYVDAVWDPGNDHYHAGSVKYRRNNS